MFVFLIIHPSIHPSGYGSNNTTVALVSTSAVSKTPSSSSTDSQHLRQQSGTVLYLISFFFSPEIMERRVPNATLQPYSIYTRAAFAWCLIRHTMRAINKEEEEEEAKSSKKQQRVQQQQKEKPYERECCDALEEPFESQLDLNQSIKGRRYWLLGSLPPSPRRHRRDLFAFSFAFSASSQPVPVMQTHRHTVESGRVECSSSARPTMAAIYAPVPVPAVFLC